MGPRETPHRVWQCLRLIRQIDPVHRGNVHPDQRYDRVRIRTSPSQCTGLVGLDANGTNENGQRGSKIHQRRLGGDPITGPGKDQRGYQPRHPFVKSKGRGSIPPGSQPAVAGGACGMEPKLRKLGCSAAGRYGSASHPAASPENPDK